MVTPWDVENLRPRLQRVMKTHQLRPEDVKHEKIHVHGRGRFSCEGASCDGRATCEGHVQNHEWESSFSWITFDLREREVCYRWKMKCKHCLADCSPTFDLDQMEKMFDVAVHIYKGTYVGRRRNRMNMGHVAPHIPLLCEKCEWGVTICWRGMLR